MNTDKLIKELELLADSCDSNYALEVNGYSQGVNDAIDLVLQGCLQRRQSASLEAELDAIKKLTIPDVSQQREQLEALEDLKDFAYDNCQPHNSDRLSEIMERL